MATTLPLIETVKIETRKDGAISWARVRVILDGAEIGADFRARVGEEPVTIDGNTITVSDAQVDSLRRSRAHTAGELAKVAAAETAVIDAVLAKLDAALAKRDASADAVAELHAYYRTNAQTVAQFTASGMPSAARDRFEAGKAAIVARHGLNR